MAVQSTADLYENKEYYAQLVKGGKIRRIRFLGIVHSFSRPEICFQVIKPKKVHFAGYNFFRLNEIGIGTSEKEAELNYGKLIDAKLPVIYNSDNDIISFLQRIEMTPRYFEYFNYRNVKE